MPSFNNTHGYAHHAYWNHVYQKTHPYALTTGCFATFWMEKYITRGRGMSMIHVPQGGFFVPKGYRNTIPSFIASLGVEWCV
jgi:hypothetical protein